MTDRFKPPSAPVADIVPPRQPSKVRTLLAVLVFSLLSLGLSWIAVPPLAGALAQALGLGGIQGAEGARGVPPAFLALDLVLSLLVATAGCYLAARFSVGHAFFAAAGVGAMESLVYFVEVGGWPGMLASEFPVWYDFFPGNALAVVLGWLLARRRDQNRSAR